MSREKPEPLAVPQAINEVWSMDFMHDQLSCVRSFRLLNVIDDFNREALGIEINFSLPSERVIRALQQIIEGAVSRSLFVAMMGRRIPAVRFSVGQNKLE